MRTAIFPGTFAPYTIGHADIVKRALNIFDEIIICVGVNADKPDARASAGSRVQSIRQLYHSEPRVRVEMYSGLTVDMVRQCGACAILRGIRSVKDMEYERNLADANLRIAGVETVLIFSDPALAWVSSSLVRELQAYGRDVSALLPPVPQD